MMIVGSKEEAEESVSVRSRFKGDEGSRKLEDFLSDVQTEIKNRENRKVEVETKDD